MNAKRLLDVTLVLAASPIYGTVLLVSAVLVALIDGRPLFFSQVRVGRERRRFHIYKLRTRTLEAYQQLSDRLAALDPRAPILDELRATLTALASMA